MKRSAAVVAVALATLALWLLMSGVGSAVPTAGAPTADPTPGGKPYPNTVGYGQVKPTRLGYSKQTLVCHIHWYSWGGQIALGTGVGFAVSPRTYKLIPAAVVVYLSDLSTVHGKPAYLRLNYEPVLTKHARPIKPC
jgi:hypothetical protein